MASHKRPSRTRCTICDRREFARLMRRCVAWAGGPTDFIVGARQRGVTIPRSTLDDWLNGRRQEFDVKYLAIISRAVGKVPLRAGETRAALKGRLFTRAVRPPRELPPDWDDRAGGRWYDVSPMFFSYNVQQFNAGHGPRWFPGKPDDAVIREIIDTEGATSFMVGTKDGRFVEHPYALCRQEQRKRSQRPKP